MDDRLQRAICARIKQARTTAGLTQQEMADLLDLTLRGYQNYEDDRVPFKRISDIARLTKTDERWLLYGGEAASQDDFREALAVVLDLLRSIDSHLVRIEQAIPALPKPRSRASKQRQP